jgi:hypothetical protein
MEPEEIERPPADAVKVTIPVDTTPEFTDTDIRTMWLMGMAPQLQRTYPMRCISCSWFTPNPKGTHGMCARLGDAASDDLVNIGTRPAVPVKATFGCNLWTEIEKDDDLHDRADLAIRRNLMDDMPTDFSPGEPLKERMREQKQAVDGVAVAKSQ